jgi:DNA-binding response OmpR family regulator
MSLQLVLIFGHDETNLEPLNQVLTEQNIVSCAFSPTLDGAMPLIEKILPDLVLVFADALEAAEENVNALCMALREASMEYRPVLVVHTSTTEETRRIEYLRDGADDILTSQLSVEELRIRLLVHLRRNLDVLSNRLTRIPGHLLSAKFLQRKLNVQEDWALLLIDIDHFEVYTEVYGLIAAEQVLKTLAALLGSIVLPPDFIGHIDSNLFSVVTTPDKAEKIAAMLCHQFEQVCPNFYSDSDRARGYVISVVDDRVSRRVGLLSVSIGVVSNQSHPYDSYWSAYQGSMAMKNLARANAGNSWVSERYQLTGSGETQQKQKSHILIVESDAALAFLLKTTLEMEHYDVDAVSSNEEAEELLQSKRYQLVLLDSILNGEPVGFEFCTRLRAAYPELMIIFISTLHDRERALGAGADLYLPKPFELMPLFGWVHRLLGTQF